MSLPRTTLSALAAVLLTLFALGCGGGSGDDTAGSGGTITKAEYVKKADKICAQTEARQQQLVDKFVKEPPKGEAAQLKVIREAGIPPLKQQVEELEALPEPDAEAEEAQAFLDEFRSELEAVEDDPAVMLTGGAFRKAEALAIKIGFQVCSGA